MNILFFGNHWLLGPANSRGLLMWWQGQWLRSWQCFFSSRNIGQVSPKIMYFHYLQKYFPDQSIWKTFYLILEKRSTGSWLRRCGKSFPCFTEPLEHSEVPPSTGTKLIALFSCNEGLTNPMLTKHWLLLHFFRKQWSGTFSSNCTHKSVSSIINSNLFSKCTKTLLAYFDPVNTTLMNNRNKQFLGWPNQYIVFYTITD